MHSRKTTVRRGSQLVAAHSSPSPRVNWATHALSRIELIALPAHLRETILPQHPYSPVESAIKALAAAPTRAGRAPPRPSNYDDVQHLPRLCAPVSARRQRQLVPAHQFLAEFLRRLHSSCHLLHDDVDASAGTVAELAPRLAVWRRPDAALERGGRLQRPFASDPGRVVSQPAFYSSTFHRPNLHRGSAAATRDSSEHPS